MNLKLFKNVVFTMLTIVIMLPVLALELSEPDLEDTKRIAAIIQTTAEYRFGNELNLGDKVVYEYNDAPEDADFKTHSLEVTEKNNEITTVLEKFEGNKVYVTFKNETKEVIKIWGTDIAGGIHELELLSKSQIEKVIPTIPEDAKREMSKYQKWIEVPDRETFGTKSIQCETIKPNLGEMNNDSSLAKKINELAKDDEITISCDVPQLLPLVPVTVPNLGKKDLLKRKQAGFVKNTVLTLKTFTKK